MSSRRTLILIGALLVGGLAAFLTLNYVRGVENRVDEDSALVPVVVASGPIAKGEQASAAIAEQNLTLTERPRQDVPANAVGRLAEVEGLVATLDLGGGEVVTSSMFSGLDQITGSKSASLDDGNVAMTVSVDSASVSGGLIQPGDLVNLLVRFEQPTGENGGEAESGSLVGDGGGVRIPRPAGYVFQGVKVFAVGTDAGTAVAKSAPADAADAADGEAPADGAESANVSAFLTVQLPPDQAALLASVRDAELYAALVPPDYVPVPVPVITELPALPGTLGLTPYSEDPAGSE